MSTGIPAEEIATQLSRARSHLARGDLAGAAAILLSVAKNASGSQAMQVAELLIASRLLDAATDVAVRIAGGQADDWAWINQFAGHVRMRGLGGASARVVDAFIAAHPSPSIERLHADIVSALGLPAAYASVDELRVARESYLRALRSLVDSYPVSALRSIGARADDFTRTNFHLAYQGCDDLDAQRVYGDWLVRSLSAVMPQFEVKPPSGTRPTIAFVSSRWHECTVGWYFASWVEHLAKSWNVILVHTPGARRDTLTQRLAQQCHGEIVLAQTIEAAAAQINSLAANVVLYPELGTDGFTFALAALRLAPVQVCAWGYPATSGLPTVDAFLSCEAMEPPRAAAHYRERLIGLPGIGTRYSSPRLPSKRSAADLHLPVDRPLYLMPQAIFKWHPDTDRQLVEIVRRDPSARFVLFELRPPSPASLVNQRLLRALGDVSAKPEEHLIWMPECTRDEYLQINQLCEVMVDTPHWSGGNATLDALLSGLPVVTLPGKFMRGRQTLGMLRLLDCDELIADSVEELADIAVALAHDRSRRDALSQRIRERLPSVIGSDDPLINMESELRKMIGKESNAILE